MCVCLFVCLSVFQWHCKSPIYGGKKKFWLKVLAPVFSKKNNFLYFWSTKIAVSWSNLHQKAQIYFLKFLVRLSVSPPLLSALVKRFSVFRTQDFLSWNYFWTQKIFSHKHLFINCLSQNKFFCLVHILKKVKPF